MPATSRPRIPHQPSRGPAGRTRPTATPSAWPTSRRHRCVVGEAGRRRRAAHDHRVRRRRAGSAHRRYGSVATPAPRHRVDDRHRSQTGPRRSAPSRRRSPPSNSDRSRRSAPSRRRSPPDSGRSRRSAPSPRRSPPDSGRSRRSAPSRRRSPPDSGRSRRSAPSRRRSPCDSVAWTSLIRPPATLRGRRCGRRRRRWGRHRGAATLRARLAGTARLALAPALSGRGVPQWARACRSFTLPRRRGGQHSFFVSSQQSFQQTQKQSFTSVTATLSAAAKPHCAPRHNSLRSSQL